MSALPPKGDIRPRDQDVCFGPKPDIVRADKESKRQLQSKSFCGLLVDYQSSFAGCSTGKSLGLA
jgi:hypothetical protein